MKVLSDGWTAVTTDGSLSAHFEHTVVVTREGCEILTLLAEDADACRGRCSRSDLRGSWTKRAEARAGERVEGRVMAQLPSGLYQVEVDGTRVTAHLGGGRGPELRAAAGRGPGAVELTPRDLTRGRM